MPVYMIIFLVPMLNISLHMYRLYKTKPPCQLDMRVSAIVSDLKYISLNLNFQLTELRYNMSDTTAH